jgi:hypothetical protein
LPCRDPWPPQPKRREEEEEEEEEVAVMPNRAANVTYPPWLSNATTSRHNMPPLLKLPTTEKANLYYKFKKKKNTNLENFSCNERSKSDNEIVN